MTVIDTNSVCTDKIATLQEHGVTTVGRYYTTYHPNYQIQRQEAEAIIAAGIKLFVVFENCANPVLDVDHGKSDAKLALAQAIALGQPEGTAIYFAAEGLPDGYHQSDVTNAKNYFSGIGQIIGERYAIGVYSSGLICDALRTAPNLCKYYWLSASTAFDGSADFYANGHWSIAQKTPVDQNWDDLSIDMNETKADFGAFGALQAAAAWKEHRGDPRVGCPGLI
jgi:hypothetical protein